MNRLREVAATATASMEASPPTAKTAAARAEEDAVRRRIAEWRGKPGDRPPFCLPAGAGGESAQIPISA